MAQSVVERLQHCGLDGVDAFERRRKVLRNGRNSIACERKKAFGVGIVDANVAQTLQRTIVSRGRARERDRCFKRIGGNDLIE